MKSKVAAATVMLSMALTANAQITKNIKYDWGWSYKLEMPETGLKCEFPEKPTSTPLAYGYMTAAAYQDELYVAAKLENPFAYDIVCRTEDFTTELKRVYGFKVENVVWDAIETENGNLTVSGDANGSFAHYHIDAIATADVLTIFIYASNDELSVPGHFFASSYSVNDLPQGNLNYMAEEKTRKRATILEYDNGRSLVRLEDSPVTVEWPDIPRLEISRHQAEYNLDKNGTHYATRIVEVGPTVSYAYFNTYIAKEHLRISKTANVKLTSDETEVSYEPGMQNEAFFRKMTYATDNGTMQVYYVAADNHIFVQELKTNEISTAEARFLNTFEQSVKNEYDTRTFVSN
ncbi:MAG: hypothetical protein ACI9UR_001799 [Bacteroidia bacterium]|jgi:hypothetical protein